MILYYIPLRHVLQILREGNRNAGAKRAAIEVVAARLCLTALLRKSLCIARPSIYFLPEHDFQNFLVSGFWDSRLPYAPCPEIKKKLLHFLQQLFLA